MTDVIDTENPEPSTEVPDDVAAMFDLSLKKKKKKKTKTKTGDSDSMNANNSTSSNNNTMDGDSEKAATSTATSSSPNENPNQFIEGNISNKNQMNMTNYGIELDPPNYDYGQLLDRVIDFLTNKDPAWSEKRRQTLKAPQLSRLGSKKTLWTNFQETCKSLHRNPDHVFQFMMAELGTEGSIDGSQRLVIRGKYVAKYIESLLRKYILEYVQCQMCRSFNTTLTKDSVSRLHFVECEDCRSSKSVQHIKAGFHAQTRADRRAQRNV